MSLDESPERDVKIKDETLTRLNLAYEKPTDQHLKNFPKDKMINLLRRDNEKYRLDSENVVNSGQAKFTDVTHILSVILNLQNVTI